MLGDFDWGSDDDYQVNANTRVKTTWGEVIEGRVIAYDKARNVVSIQVPFPDNNGQKQIRIININAIAQQLLGAVPSNTNQLLPLTKDVPAPEKIQKIEQESISKMQNASKKIGVGVPKEAQDIFNAIENMYNQTIWKDKSILVMNEILVDPPYGTANCHCTKKNGNIQLQKLVQNIIEKHQSMQRK